MKEGLLLIADKKFENELTEAVNKAADALEDYKNWIELNLSKMNKVFSIGRENYIYYLRNIALMTYTPEELLLMGKSEWNRSVAFDVFERERNIELPELKIFSSADEQIVKEKEFEIEIRKFLVEKNLMSAPDWVQHYINKKTPPHIEPFTNMGVVDDLTSETRLDEDGVAYIPEPSEKMSYFRLATAKDPRPIIIHEGVPVIISRWFFRGQTLIQSAEDSLIPVLMRESVFMLKNCFFSMGYLMIHRGRGK